MRIVKSIAKTIIRMLPASISTILMNAVRGIIVFGGGAGVTYSQDGEDLIIGKIFDAKIDGFYVDIGSHHPRYCSNTLSLYNSGWNGINIDPKIGMKALFDKDRPRDINLEMGVSDRKAELPYYVFNESSVNTLVKDNADRNVQLGYKLIEERSIKVDTISNILNTFASGKEIDMMTIDVEGHELEILNKNDWSKHRPKILLVEMMKTKDEETDTSIFRFSSRRYWLGMDEIEANPIHVLMKSHGYRLFSKGIMTFLYVDVGQKLL